MFVLNYSLTRRKKWREKMSQHKTKKIWRDDKRQGAIEEEEQQQQKEREPYKLRVTRFTGVLCVCVCVHARAMMEKNKKNMTSMSSHHTHTSDSMKKKTANDGTLCVMILWTRITTSKKPRTNGCSNTIGIRYRTQKKKESERERRKTRKRDLLQWHSHQDR